MSYYEGEGYKIYYEVFGEGYPLLMIHGNTASSLMLEDEVNFYSKYFKVIIVDIIGHGRSERLEEFPVNFWNENAKILNGLCKKLDIDKVNILGTSGGAIIGLNFAISYPEIINKVIADSFNGAKLSLKDVKIIKEEREKIKNNGLTDFWRYMHGKNWEKVIDADTDMLINFAQKYENNFSNNLDKIDCPVLIIGSLKDKSIEKIEKKACDVAKKIKFSTTVFSSKGDHPLMLSNRKFFRKIALNFLKKDTLIMDNF